jgi:hypothetical protein
MVRRQHATLAFRPGRLAGYNGDMRPQALGGVSPAAAAPRRRHRSLVWSIALGCALIAVASFLKTDWPRNDFERFDDLRLTVAFFILLTAACLGYAKLCLDEVPLSKGMVVGGALAAGALLWVSFPVGSKDLFLYALFGKVWGTYHMNPYQVAPARLAGDPWLTYGQTPWAQRPAPYGPLFLWQALVIDVAARGHLWVAAWAHKLVATAALAGVLVVAAHFPRPRVRGPWQDVALLAWNPLLLFESVGNGHNEAVMLLLLVAAAWCHVRRHASRAAAHPSPARRAAATAGAPIDPRRWEGDASVAGRPWRPPLASVLLTLAIWYKWYAALVMPAFLVAVYCEAGWVETRRWLLSAFAVGVLFGALLMAPFADATPLLLQRLMAHENIRTVFPLQLSPPLALLLWASTPTGASGLLWFDAIRAVLFSLWLGAVLWLQWRGRITLVQSVCLLALDGAMFGLTILWPWHLMVPIAFALLAGTQAWISLALGLTLLGLLSYFFTFLWAAVALIIIAGALPLMRHVPRLSPSAART